jgi:hypothetical protein
MLHVIFLCSIVWGFAFVHAQSVDYHSTPEERIARRQHVQTPEEVRQQIEEVHETIMSMRRQMRAK